MHASSNKSMRGIEQRWSCKQDHHVIATFHAFTTAGMVFTRAWAENQPPSIFGSSGLSAKAMPAAVARLANETDNVHSHHARAAAKAKKVSRWNDFWNK